MTSRKPCWMLVVTGALLVVLLMMQNVNASEVLPPTALTMMITPQIPVLTRTRTSGVSPTALTTALLEQHAKIVSTPQQAKPLILTLTTETHRFILQVEPHYDFIHPNARIVKGDVESPLNEMAAYTGTVRRVDTPAREFVSMERMGWAHQDTFMGKTLDESQDTFVTHAKQGGWASLMFFNTYGKASWLPTMNVEATFVLDGWVYHVSKDDSGNLILSGRVRHEETKEIENTFANATEHNHNHHFSSCGVSHSQFIPESRLNLETTSKPSSHRLFKRNAIGCPESRKILYMGVAADCAFTSAVDGQDAALARILRTWNAVSALYLQDFNISLGIIEVQIQATCTPQTIAWNQACSGSYTISQRLNDFSAWRSSRSTDAGLWHLMSACPTGSTIGLAWRGALCMTTSEQGPNGDVYSGTGVSTYQSGSNSDFEVVAHEIGHGFGAHHDCTSDCSCQGTTCTDCCACAGATSQCNCNGQFIMSPVLVGKSNDFSPCTKEEICNRVFVAGGQCLQDPSTRGLIQQGICGNGVKEANEDCDCGDAIQCQNNTCCTPQCKFKNNAACSDNNQVCCLNCQIISKAANVTCRAGTGMCNPSEQCDGVTADCPPDVKAQDGSTCEVAGAYCASGQCTNRNMQCQLVGRRYGATMACNDAGDSKTAAGSGFSDAASNDSCDLQCSNSTLSGTCLSFPYSFLDGTSCQNGRCYSGFCQQSTATRSSQSMTVIILAAVSGVLLFGLILFGVRYCLKKKNAKVPWPEVTVDPMRSMLPASPPRLYPGSRPVSTLRPLSIYSQMHGMENNRSSQLFASIPVNNRASQLLTSNTANPSAPPRILLPQQQ